MDFDADLVGLTGNDLILAEARRDYKRCMEFYGDTYKNSLDDTKFANADSRNNWQWPDIQYGTRTDEDKPCLTINKTRTHNDICCNEAMRNKSSIKIRPTGGHASYKASEVMQSIVRRIEYVSKATIGYRKAITDQIDGGFGYVLLDTGYVNDRSFDQDIYIKPCRDPRGVFIDPDCEQDGTNAQYGFTIDRMARHVFNKKYPKLKNLVGKNTILGEDPSWVTEGYITVAMYYQRKGTKDVFIRYTEPTSGTVVDKLKSEIVKESGQELYDQLIADLDEGKLDGKTRETTRFDVKWYLIAGDVIAERGDWAGKYVPIIPCWGRYTLIEGKLDVKSHTRSMIDPQRMLNYNASAFIEYGALQTKSPYIAPARAIEGQEQWKDMNVKNYPVVTYNDVDEEATHPEMAKIERPQREAPPQSSPVYAEGMVSAERWMMMVSGQYQAQMGEDDKQSAASGRAINERQRQGDTATWHFNEGQSDMFRNLGMQLIDLIPKLYDTERRLHVLGEDGTKSWITIQPNNTEAVKELKKESDEASILEFNPAVGEYDCMADPGPNYATQRQEAWNAISVILQQNMQLAALIGDLLFRYGDFPGADEIAERLKKEIQATKPYLFDDEQNPGAAAMQMQVQKLQALNTELMQKLAEMTIKMRGREEKRDIEAFNAETARMKAQVEFLAKIALTPAQQAQMEHELMSKSHDHVYGMIKQANEAEIAQNQTTHEAQFAPASNEGGQ